MSRYLCILAALLGSIWSTPWLPAQNNSGVATTPTEVWIASRIWLGQGAPIENGAIVVRDGKIISVGPANSVQIPAGANRRELGECHLVPGLILAETNLAGSEDDEQAITPYFRALDAFDFFGDYADLLAQGVTAVQIAPGAARLMPGQSAVVKLSGDDLAVRTLSESESLRILLTSAAFNPPTVYEPPIGAVSETRPLEPTRPQLASSLSGAVAGLRILFQSARDPLAENLPPQDRDILETLRSAAQGQLGVRLTALTASEIRAAAQLARELGIQPLLVRPEQTVAVDQLLVGADSPFKGFVLPLPAGVDRIANRPVADPDRPAEEMVWEVAGRLHQGKRGADIAVSLSTREEINKLWFSAGLLKRGGLSTADILALLTDNPARLMGVSHRVGNLTAGKDADFVILSGAPFERHSKVLETVVNGKSVWKQTSTDAQPATARIVRAASIYTDHGAWQAADISIVGSSIVGVGPGVTVPDRAVVDSFPGAVVVPGMLDLNTTLGFGGALNNQFPLNTKLGELLMSDDDAVAAVRRAGITTVLAAPARLPAPVIAYKLTDQPQVLRDPVALRFEVTANLTQAASSLRTTLTRGKEYFEQWQRYDAAMAEYAVALKAYEAKLAEYEAAKAKQEQEKQAAEKAAAEKAAAEKAAAENPGAGGGAPATTTSPASGTPPAPGTPPTPSTPPATGTPPGGTQSPGGSGTDGNQAKPADAAVAAPATENKQAETVELKAPEKPVEPKKPNQVPAMDPYRDLFAGKIPAMVEAQQFKAIELTVKIFAEEFGLATIITGATDLAESAVVLKHPKVSVIVGPSLSAGRDETLTNLPQWLATQRVPFGFRSNAETGSAELPLAVEYATYQGLGVTDALRGMTAGPAQFLGLDRVGAIAPGRDADLVVLSGPPFELGTEVLAVMVNGQWVYQKESR